MTVLDFKLRDVLPHLRNNGRLNVLIDLVLRANDRNRCWPSMRLIAQDTGYALEAVNNAKKWLIAHGAIKIVEYNQRVDEERKVPRRQSIYQLTGTLQIDGKIYPYIYVSPAEISPAEDEVVKDSKSVQKKNDYPAENPSAMPDESANADSRVSETDQTPPPHQKPNVSVQAIGESTLCSIGESLPGVEAAITPAPLAQQGLARQTPTDTHNATLVGARHTMPNANTVPLAQQGLARQTPTDTQNATPVGAWRAMPSEVTPSPPGKVVPHSHNISPIQAAIMHAFKLPRGAYAGRIGQFFAGKIPRRKDRWGQYQPERGASPQEVLGLLIWYRQHPAYAKSFIEHGHKLPSTPAILGERLDEFRESPVYAQSMQQAQPLLERLLRGEAVPTVQAPPQVSAGPVESAAAYAAYDPTRDPAAQRRETDAEAVAMFEKLFGESHPSPQPLSHKGRGAASQEAGR